MADNIDIQNKILKRGQGSVSAPPPPAPLFLASLLFCVVVGAVAFAVAFATLLAGFLKTLDWPPCETTVGEVPRYRRLVGWIL